MRRARDICLLFTVIACACQQTERGSDRSASGGTFHGNAGSIGGSGEGLGPRGGASGFGENSAGETATEGGIAGDDGTPLAGGTQSAGGSGGMPSGGTTHHGGQGQGGHSQGGQAGASAGSAGASSSPCGTQTCAANEVCLQYGPRCTPLPSGGSCPSGTQPTTCYESHTPGCLEPSCNAQPHCVKLPTGCEANSTPPASGCGCALPLCVNCESFNPQQQKVLCPCP